MPSNAITAWLSGKIPGCSKSGFKTPWKSPCNILAHIKPLCVFKLQSERRASTFEDLATLRPLPAFTLRGPEGSCSWKHIHGFRINPLIGLELRHVLFCCKLQVGTCNGYQTVSSVLKIREICSATCQMSKCPPCSCSWNETLSEAWQPTRNLKFSWSWWPQTMKTRTAKWGNYYYGADRFALVLAAIKMKRGLLSLESGAHLGSFSKRKHSSLIYSSACSSLSTSFSQTTKEQLWF